MLAAKIRNLPSCAKGMIKLKIGFAMSGSFCNIKRATKELERLKERGDELLPIMSYNVYNTDTKFGEAEALRSYVRDVTHAEIIHTIPDAEPIGPKIKLDCLCICPCSGNTLAKLARGICDTPVTMAAKAHLRNERPLVVAIASNDALCGNAESLGIMLARRNVYFVPFSQDDPANKPRSAVCDFERLSATIDLAVKGLQIQPILL